MHGAFWTLSRCDFYAFQGGRFQLLEPFNVLPQLGHLNAARQEGWHGWAASSVGPDVLQLHLRHHQEAVGLVIHQCPGGPDQSRLFLLSYHTENCTDTLKSEPT